MPGRDDILGPTDFTPPPAATAPPREGRHRKCQCHRSSKVDSSVASELLPEDGTHLNSFGRFLATKRMGVLDLTFGSGSSKTK